MQKDHAVIAADVQKFMHRCGNQHVFVVEQIKEEKQIGWRQ